MAFEIRAKDLPLGKFPNSTFEGSLRPAGEDPAESNDPITDKSRGGCVSPKLPVENIKLQESNMNRPMKKRKKENQTVAVSSSWPRPASNCSIPLIRQLRLTSRAVTGADREQDSGRNSCVYILADARCSNTVKLRPVTLHGVRLLKCKHPFRHRRSLLFIQIEISENVSSA